MVFAILVFVYRKPGTTMAEFIHHYESVHINVIREVAGEYFPTSHTRHYLERADGAASSGALTNAETPATMYRGEQKTIDYDCIAEIVFKDKESFRGFHNASTEPQGAAKLRADEELFIDVSKTTVVACSQTTSTSK